MTIEFIYLFILFIYSFIYLFIYLFIILFDLFMLYVKWKYILIYVNCLTINFVNMKLTKMVRITARRKKFWFH